MASQNKWRNPAKAIAAKIRAKKHVETIECYGCHSAWAPQCYGCHVNVDFSGNKKATDWVAAGNTHFKNGHTAESMRDVERCGIRAPGRKPVALNHAGPNEMQ